MANTREIAILVVLILAIILLVKAIEFFKPDIQPADASKFVVEDLHSKYSNADIEIMTITEMHNDNGDKYYEIKVKVTKNPLGPCPERMHIFYNYPDQNFVSQPTEYITRNCKVCTEGTCIMVFPEEAVIASHTFEGTEAVDAYITQYDAIPTTTEADDVWTVKWDSEDAPNYYIVALGINGKIESVEEVAKEPTQ